MPIDVREGQLTSQLENIVSALGPGEPLPSSTKGPLQCLSKVPLDGVRVHDDRNSHFTAGLLGSEAFTVGNHIVIGDPRISQKPHDWLLAHEVAHTIQQHSQTIGAAARHPEWEADQYADRVTEPSSGEVHALPELNPTSVGFAPRVIWRFTHDVPGDLLLVLDVDDGDFVGGCVKAIVPHVGAKLIKKGVPKPFNQIFNLHIGFITNPAGEFCIFFYESVTRICELMCESSKEKLQEKWEEVKEWLKNLIKKVAEALAILAALSFLIAEAIAAALAVLLGLIFA